MWVIGVLLLGFVVASSGSLIEEIHRKISSASECIHRLVDCSSVYSPIAVTEINGSLFSDPRDLDKACSLNAEYIRCLESTESFCVTRNLGVTEETMLENRLWVRDLCYEDSRWREAYRRRSSCIIKECSKNLPRCTQRQTPIDPRFVGLADMCRFLKGINECIAFVLRRMCGRQAEVLFLRVSLMRGNREYLCEEEEALPQDSASLRAAKQVLRSARSLMAKISSVVMASLWEMDAAYVLQEMGEPPLFEMQDLINDEDEDNETHDEDDIQIIEVHTAKKTKSQTEGIIVKSHEEERIENQKYALVWSSKLIQYLNSREINLKKKLLYADAPMHPIQNTAEEPLYSDKKDEVDSPEESVYADASIHDTEVEYKESLYPVQDGKVDYPEDASMHPAHNTEEIECPESLYPVRKGGVDYPEDGTDSSPQSHQSQEIYDHPCEDPEYSDPQFHLVRKDIKLSDQSSDAYEPRNLSQDNEVHAELEDLYSVLSDDVDSDKVLSEDEDQSCQRLDNKFPKAFKSNASFHMYAVRNRGMIIHMGSGLTVAPWKLMTGYPFDYLFCNWLNPTTPRILFKCVIKFMKLEPAEREKKRPRTYPILLALYTSPPSSAAEVVSMSEVVTICVKDYQPPEEILPYTISRFKFIAVVKNGEHGRFCFMEELETKHSIQERSLELLQENEVSDPFDRNLSLVSANELPERIKDIKEKSGTLLEQKMSYSNGRHRPFRYQIPNDCSWEDCQIPDELFSKEGYQIHDKDSTKKDCQRSEVFPQRKTAKGLKIPQHKLYLSTMQAPSSNPQVDQLLFPKSPIFKTSNFVESDNPEITGCKNGSTQTLSTGSSRQ